MLAPIQFVRELLPVLRTSPESHIVNIASIYGLVAFGRFTAYNVSKFGLVGLSESLRAEYGRQGIGVSTICPGFVSTNLFASALSGYPDGRKPEPPRLLCTSPECVANKVIRAIYRDRRLTLITPMAHFLYHVSRFAPGLIDFVNRLGRRRRIAKNAARRARETAPPIDRTGPTAGPPIPESGLSRATRFSEYQGGNMKRLTDWLAYLAVRITVCLIQALRLETCGRLSRLLAALACDVLKIRSSVVDENIRHVFPQLDPAGRRGLARRMWEHLLLMIAEIAHAPRKIHDTNWRDYFYFVRDRETVQYLLGGRPVVMVSGHFGNFELGSYLTGLLGYRGYLIARPLDNPYLDRYVSRFRAAYGQIVLPKHGSAGRSRPCSAAAAGSACWATSTPARKGAGSIFSAGPPRATRRWPC